VNVAQASKARVASMYDEELELQHPLFAVHGYDDKKVSVLRANYNLNT